MPHALLLSPDDQAVSAITGVLEELSVTCERPLDGPSAAKKLHSESFDLVLVDCENLPAAKLIFDVCRRPNAGVNPVPIAIVDGRAGLPTAFRLGAELILTKPVAKDQARTTIRTAVNRIKKDEPVRAPHLFEEAPAEAVSLAPTEIRAQAAAVAATSSFAKPVEVTPPPAKAQATVDTPMPAIGKMQSSTEEIGNLRVQSKQVPMIARDLTPPQSFAPLPKPAPPAPPPVPKPSDDPVLADLESDLPSPVLPSRREAPQKKGHGSLWLLLFLMLAGGGFYAAWLYQPGFREMVQPWVERAIGAIHVPGQSPNSAPPRRTTAPAPATAPQTQTPSTGLAPVPDATSPATGSDDSVKDSAPANADAPTAKAPASNTPAPVENGSASPESGDSEAPPADSAKSAATQSESKKKSIAAVASDAELPGEKSAVILSSVGAEKRLVHHVPPVYPAEARKERIEGTVVLKAVVNESGKVAGVRLVEGNPTLAAAAISAVKQWRYRPYLRNDKAQPFQTIVLVEFQRH